MANTNEHRPELSAEPSPAPPGAAPTGVRDGPPAATTGPAADASKRPSEAGPPSRAWRKWLLLAGAAVGLVVAAWFLVPWLVTVLTTVSTDDAYVNGHVTFVAPRVAGQVRKVLVDDNYRVKKGDVLVQLDKEPFRVQLAIKQAAVAAAEADLAAANAQVRGQVAQARANRYKLTHAIEDVNTQVANLAAAVATLNNKKAMLDLARGNLKRGEELAPGGGISKEELDQRRQTVKQDEAAVDQALQDVYAIRVGLGLPAQPPRGQELTSVPPNLEQDFSTVRQDLATLIQSAAQFGYHPATWDATPKQAVGEFYKHDPLGYTHLIAQTLAAQGLAPGGPPAGPMAQQLVALECLESEGLALDRIYALIIPSAPAIKQAEAKLLQASRDLAQAELDLRYTDVVSEIDGVVTRRNINPGNNVAVGQNLMAVRSLTEIWIDANFKETQLADLRIGQRARVEVDMYGRRKEFEGRITGFTMGTGQTLALLPPQNATGNYVKIVQRLPVRIELTDYDPDKDPLFVGLSVVPHVYYREPPTGPNAGAVLQPVTPLPQAPADPKP